MKGDSMKEQAPERGSYMISYFNEGILLYDTLENVTERTADQAALEVATYRADPETLVMVYRDGRLVNRVEAS